MSVARYTRYVAFSKLMLWLLVACIAGMLVLIASDNTGENKARLVFSKAAKNDAPENVMIKPHFQGMDENNQPYTVIADKAVQADKDTVELTMVSADMLREGDGKDTWLALTADTGTLNTETKKIDLSGGVDMFYEGGYEFRTDRAHIDIQQGTAYGDRPVEGQGPMGTLKADEFSVADRGRVIRFNGSVRMTLYP